ncbi:alcohol oxidase-like protein [Stachybotrys elegans]|uniref:Alcohol oxidase-like protein n=1 Tax=Stachybotrys elegans TaxID=80388 RepID=A0A8K0WIS0_9HYPO|nr:alcohol oxidase-like protein [Stachybotrys elegans]
MPLYTELPADIESVDVIIAGGGTAACVVASRLSDADPSLSILVVEAGPNSYQDPTITVPFLFFSHLMPTSKTMTFHVGQPSPFLGDRPAIVPTAKVLGGGSAVNFLMYSRGQRSDFDSWAMPGWSADELLPYMKKFETYHGKCDTAVHGTDGPIHISEGTFSVPRATDTFVHVSEKMGWKEQPDISDLKTVNAVQRAKRYISPQGQRQDASHAYLHPRLMDGKHPNLHVVVESKVVSVTFDGDRASGVTFVSGGTTRTIKASKQVVVSCGACGTPPVLERSGIGAKDVLERANVPVLVDLPGVGDGYEDHHTMTYQYKSDLAAEETLDGIITGTFDIPGMLQRGDKITGWNCLEGTGKLRPDDKDLGHLGPQFQEVWDRDFKNQADRPLTLMVLIMGGEEPVPEGGQHFSMSVFTAYPYSRGHMHITGPGVDDPLDFDAGLFNDDNSIDLLTCRWAYKKQREVARRLNIFRGEFKDKMPAYSANSKAKAEEYNKAVSSDTLADHEYTAEDDAAIDEFIKKRVSTPWHSLGTAKMAPREAKGVVDETLSVYGIKGLKIADLSICPKNVAAHTNATAFMVGEKAADILIKELGLGA